MTFKNYNWSQQFNSPKEGNNNNNIDNYNDNDDDDNDWQIGHDVW